MTRPNWRRAVRMTEPRASCAFVVVEGCYHVTDQPRTRDGRYTGATVLGRGSTQADAWKAAALSVRAA